MNQPRLGGLELAIAARSAFERRDYAAAKHHARALLLENPQDPVAHQILGAIALDLGEFTDAKDHLERSNNATPHQPHTLNMLGVALRRLGETASARAAFRRSGELGLIDGFRNLGNLEFAESNLDASIAAYQRALQLDGQDPAAHAGLAQSFECRHELERAKEHARSALAGDARNENARLALAHVLLREGDFEGAELAVAPLVRMRDASKTNEALAWGVIGEARDRRGATREAFQAFTAANRILLEQNRALLKATHRLVHPEGIRRMMQIVRQVQAYSWSRPSDEYPAPVFLVGFPRSGTTLLDQVLSSHSRIVCSEEREHMIGAVARILSDNAKLENLDALAGEEIEFARSEYWRRMRSDLDVRPDTLVVDKLPLNIIILPLIKRVFPDSKVIFALRDPRDVVLSCYQQRFGMNAAMAHFLQLETAAAYYDLVMRLFELAREHLDLDLHTLKYESVVADLDGAARDLAGYLGVPFEESMLDYQATARSRTINTPSARQVVEPLYVRSIGRWRRYEEDLAPVLPTLDKWAERLGYDK